ncbi:hypothetical protein BKA62DRAFT_232361 [Auriculariales sp. MPI-PUGE-AT-0066]|nr:hypothetical protein BKA62DRAFT_232361 [Auriculariales sp. MPI-PUGE-AT-0066]
MRHFDRTFAITGESESPKATDMWNALSDTERQQFTKEAQDNQLRVAEYDEWAQAIGSTSLRQINRDRVRSGKKRLRMPTSLRPVRKLSGFRTFLEAKVASGEIFTRNGYAAAKKHAIELWIELDPSQKAVRSIAFAVISPPFRPSTNLLPHCTPCSRHSTIVPI